MLLAGLALLAGALLTASLDVAGLRAGATPPELLMWGAVGVLFARVFALGPLVVAVPLLLAGIELAAGGSGAVAVAGAGDPLTLALPGARSLELTAFVFAAAYATWAVRFGLRPELTLPLLLAVLVASVLTELPALTLLAAALLLPALDRLPALLQEP